MLSRNGYVQVLTANLHVWGKTSMSLSKHVKEHSKEGNNSAIYQHCSTKGHPLPNIDQFIVIDKEVSQVACEARGNTHLKFRSRSNKNIGKMVIPCVFGSLLSVKPKNLHIS